MNAHLLQKRLSAKQKYEVESLGYSKHLKKLNTGDVSLAVDCYELGVIEVSACVVDNIPPLVQRLVEKFGSYTEFDPDIRGVRIIGFSCEGCRLEFENVIESDNPETSPILSVYRRCNRRIALSGITLFDRPLAHIDRALNELITNPDDFFDLA